MGNQWRVIEGMGDFENLATCHDVSEVGISSSRKGAQVMAEEHYEGVNHWDKSYFVIVQEVVAPRFTGLRK